MIVKDIVMMGNKQRQLNNTRNASNSVETIVPVHLLNGSIHFKQFQNESLSGDVDLNVTSKFGNNSTEIDFLHELILDQNGDQSVKVHFSTGFPLSSEVSLNDTAVSLTNADNLTDTLVKIVGNFNLCDNYTNYTSDVTNENVVRTYWAFALFIFPVMAIFGNILVILGVIRERNLQTVTNYFIISLAFADLLVAVTVMPFGVYALASMNWGLGDLMCDMYIAIDVTCSTASIFNLVAISIDRYIAITKPITYSKHKQSKLRVSLTISIVWISSSLIASPIVLGLNNTPERDHATCAFYNSDFIIYSSLGSFFVPCLIMIYLYYKIFSAIHKRASRISERRNAKIDSTKGAKSNVIQNTHHSAKNSKSSNRQRNVDGEVKFSEIPVVEVEPPTAYHEETNETLPQGLNPECNSHRKKRRSSAFIQIHGTIDECQIISNNAQLTLAPYVKKPRVEKDFISTISVQVSANDITDSGYVPSNVEESSPVSKSSPGLELQKLDDCMEMFSTALNPSSTSNDTVDSQPEALATTEGSQSKKSNIPAFAIAMMTSNLRRRRREKSTAKRERKATKTLAIVLGVFLACWLPFFTCNVLTAICMKIDVTSCISGIELFMSTTWIGYINSCLNPIIYTVFNMEFRKAFKKLILQPCLKN